MDRRFAFKTLLSGAFGAGAMAATRAAAAPAAADAAKVAYHVADFDKGSFALGNIANHYDGMGGPAKVRIVLVALGPGLRPFVAQKASPELTARLTRLVGLGLEAWACGNTLAGMKLAGGDLLPGFRVAEQGGVVKLAELQGAGFCYLRP
jgi:intracellular sulfur oxidation DsrE/DsrF family protein